jgi:hypothetical protein
MTELQSKILQLTPRLARRYIYPANMLSDENRLELERAMEIGIPRQTLIPLLRSGHLIPFVKHLGGLPICLDVLNAAHCDLFGYTPGNNTNKRIE